MFTKTRYKKLNSAFKFNYKKLDTYVIIWIIYT